MPPSDIDEMSIFTEEDGTVRLQSGTGPVEDVAKSYWKCNGTIILMMNVKAYGTIQSLLAHYFSFSLKQLKYIVPKKILKLLMPQFDNLIYRFNHGS